MSGNLLYRLTYNLSSSFDKVGDARDIYHFKLETYDLSIPGYLPEKSFMITSKTIPDVDDYLIFYKIVPGDMDIESWQSLDVLRDIHKCANDSEELEELIYDKFNYYQYGVHIHFDNMTCIIGGATDDVPNDMENNMECVD
jgi:hypothetical protein